MIQFTTTTQQIELRGTTAPRLVVQSAPATSLRLTSGGPRGPQGERGPPGPAGGEDANVPDFTLIYENRLV